MQKYIHVVSGRYPITANEIKNENPNTSFPLYIQHESARHLGYEPVTDVTPTYDPEIQYVKEFAPINYQQTWQVINYTTEELAQRAADKAESDQRAAEQLEATRKADIFAQIAVIEKKQDRSVREAILTGNNTYLQQYEDQIAALRATL
jgi:hypothetical protein